MGSASAVPVRIRAIVKVVPEHKPARDLGWKTLNADAIIVLAGVSKMHVGEMVEKARELAEKRGNYGPLLPQDMRAAFAEISSTTSASNVHHRRRF
ncbi:hypothetical protein WJX84_007892 [Apatococcus fuscideae]|uniref:TAFII28-like protein domain-containing protein n=1 Tax=Apatococcus fuscideae TaxID=2026836 RepID=A0AAW1T082_9CHLO